MAVGHVTRYGARQAFYKKDKPNFNLTYILKFQTLIKFIKLFLSPTHTI